MVDIFCIFTQWTSSLAYYSSIEGCLIKTKAKILFFAVAEEPDHGCEIECCPEKATFAPDPYIAVDPEPEPDSSYEPEPFDYEPPYCHGDWDAEEEKCDCDREYLENSD